MIKQRIDAQRLSVDNSRMSNSNGTPDFKGFVDMGDSECAVSAGCLPLSSVELVPLTSSWKPESTGYGWSCAPTREFN